MFAFAFISTARLTIRPTTVRLVRTGLAALAIIIAAVSLAEAKGFGGGGGGNGGGTKSFTQKFFSNNNPQKTTNIANKPITLKQNSSSSPSKSFSSDCKTDKCHDKCCYHRCHSYCDYSYCGWGFCDNFDLQLISVQMLDSGNPAEGVGPMFRVTFRNNSFSSINRPFSLSLMTLADPTSGGTPVGVRVRSIGGFQTAAVDIRMPLEAMRPSLGLMQAIVDSHREIGEINESNNVLLVKLAEVRPVATEKAIAAPVTEAAPAVAADATLQAEIAKEPMADEQND